MENNKNASSVPAAEVFLTLWGLAILITEEDPVGWFRCVKMKRSPGEAPGGKELFLEKPLSWRIRQYIKKETKAVATKCFLLRYF